MAILIENSVVIPERNFNKVWIEEAVFIQNKSQTPKYDIRIKYSLYSEGGAGFDTYLFDNIVHDEIIVSDIEPIAIAAAMAGDTKLVEAMTQFEACLAKIMDHFIDSVGDTTVVTTP